MLNRIASAQIGFCSLVDTRYEIWGNYVRNAGIELVNEILGKVCLGDTVCQYVEVHTPNATL